MTRKERALVTDLEKLRTAGQSLVTISEIGDEFIHPDTRRMLVREINEWENRVRRECSKLETD